MEQTLIKNPNSKLQATNKTIWINKKVQTRPLDPLRRMQKKSNKIMPTYPLNGPKHNMNLCNGIHA